MPENNQILSVEGQLIGMPTAGPESFSQQQLDYLKRALGVDETVLWDGTAASVDTAKSGLTLTESPFNFEYVEVHWVPWAYNDAGSYKQEAVVRVHLTSSFPRIGLINEWTDESNAAMFLFSVNGYFTSTKFYTTHVTWFQIGAWTVNNTGTGQYITKIVGIHRISGGN